MKSRQIAKAFGEHSVDIETTAREGFVYDDGGSLDWRGVNSASGQEISAKEYYRRVGDRTEAILREEHHRLYGMPWCIGKTQFDYLLELGLRPDHKFLDLGCGAARLGIWLIQYLDVGCYFGIDAHRFSLEAAAQYEIPLHGLAAKTPRFLHSFCYDIEHFGASFDYAIAYSALGPAIESGFLSQRLVKIAEHLRPNGKFIVAHVLPELSSDAVSQAGLYLANRSTRSFLDMGQPTYWYEYHKA